MQLRNTYIYKVLALGHCEVKEAYTIQIKFYLVSTLNPQFNTFLGIYCVTSKI